MRSVLWVAIVAFLETCAFAVLAIVTVFVTIIINIEEVCRRYQHGNSVDYTENEVLIAGKNNI